MCIYLSISQYLLKIWQSGLGTGKFESFQDPQRPWPAAADRPAAPARPLGARLPSLLPCQALCQVTCQASCTVLDVQGTFPDTKNL